MPRTLLLASSSKWRRMVLEETLMKYEGTTKSDRENDEHIQVTQWNPNIDEKSIRSTIPSELVLMVGRAKLEAAKEYFLSSKANETTENAISSSTDKVKELPEWILAGDQVTVYQCKSEDDPMLTGSIDRYIDRSAAPRLPTIILEKPETKDENRLFLRSYSNYFVTTVASQVLYHVPTEKTFEGIDKNIVHFGDISERVIESVISRGDSMYCCGGFVVEDEALNQCVTHIEGSLQGVQGLGPDLLCHLLDQSLMRK